jgi:hypothetical protein
VVEENLANINEQLRMAGEPLSYGCTVQLRHSSSGKYLTLMRTRAERDTTALKMEADESGGEGSYWRLLPAYKSKREGDKVMPNDVVLLVSEKMEKTFLSVSALGQRHPRDTAKDRVTAQSLHTYVQERLEVNANHEPTRVKLIPCAQTASVLELDTSLPKAQERLKGGE